MLKVISLGLNILSKFFISPLSLISHINFDYVIDLYKYKFEFNIKENIDNDLQIYTITIKNIKKIIRYLDKIDFEDISKKFNNHFLFLVSSKIMENNIYKFIISNVINNNSYIYVYNKDDKQINKYPNINMFIKINLKSKLLSNNKNILKLFSNYLINLQKRHTFHNKKFYNFEETMDAFLNMNICRFSDGEFNIMLGLRTNFQECNNKLSVSMNDAFLYFSKKSYPGGGIAINKKIVYFSNIINDRSLFHEMNCKQILIENINDIYDANIWSITPYMLYYKKYNYLDKPFCLCVDNRNYDIFDQKFYTDTKLGSECLKKYNQYFENWFKKLLFKYKNVVLVSNKKNKFFLDLNFFANTNVDFIETPEKNSFSKIEEIKSKIKVLNKKNTLFLISCGPAGKVLCKYIDEIKSKFVDIGNFVNYYSYFNNYLRINRINDVHNPSIINKKEKTNHKN